MKTTTIKSLLIAGAILASTSAMANGEMLFKKCSACHGVHAEKKALGKSKVINEMSATEIATALHGYKDGTYGGPMKGLMKGQVAKLSDEDIKTLSEHISTLKK
jgi:cytochrome c553